METDDEFPTRRTSTPLGRLDDQRAGFSTHASTSSTTTPYGSPAQPPSPAPPRARRPSPKSAGSASLPVLTRHDSWEDVPRLSGGLDAGGSRRRASLRRIERGRPEEDGPFADPLMGDWGWSTRSETSSLPPQTPDLDFDRRGSAVSTSSALSSQSPHSRYPPLPSDSSLSCKRHSVSSFGAHTITTIGDVSTTSSSMPLLRQQDTHGSQGDGAASLGPSSSRRSAGGGRRPSSGGTGAAGARTRGDSSASCGYSDKSSLHSYPPKPRQRASSTAMGSSDEGGWKRWAREIEATSATGHVQRRGSADSRNDIGPGFPTNSYIPVPVNRPAASYQSALSTYSFSTLPSRSFGGASSPPVPHNPLAPLRKRLARSLAVTTGRRQLHAEVQLLLELVDALEHCIATFAPTGDGAKLPHASGDAGAGGSGGSLPGSTSVTSSLSSTCDATYENPLAASPTSTCSSTWTAGVAAAVAATPSARLALVDEVRLLVREVVELVPDAQRCLTLGAYGPLASPAAAVSTRALLDALEQHAPRAVAADAEWWPRRLVRDCRALLDEAGLPTRQGSATQTVWALATRLSDDADAAIAAVPALGAAGGAYAPRGGTAAAAPHSDARREELLLQGKQRWEQYRERQSALERYAEGGRLL
ncbi:hypothetical protein JCM3770_005173 [Rhodotorula araucariae]